MPNEQPCTKYICELCGRFTFVNYKFPHIICEGCRSQAYDEMLIANLWRYYETHKPQANQTSEASSGGGEAENPTTDPSQGTSQVLP